MTAGERIELKEYMREQFEEIRVELQGIKADVAELKDDKTRRDGRDNFVAKAAKALATTIVTAGAAIGAYLGLKS